MLWWVSIRVWMLRQDLFTIRNELWLSMIDKGQLDDPSHREIRDQINTLSRIAPLIMSIFTFLRFYFNARTESDELDAAERVKPAAMDPDVNTALDRIVQRILRFFLHETLSGILVRIFVHLICLFIFVPLSIARRVSASLVEQVVRSPELRSFGRLVPTGKP